MDRLDNINSPEDIRHLSTAELEELAAEIRRRIIEGVSESGGHLASSLGVVELTLALHYVFDTPKDKIVWDVGHQCYTHKLITGRKDRFDTLRKFKGIAGFPKRDESEYDAFDTGHSSTSISVAVGMTEARDLLGEKYKVIAVIGDGAMTAGLAFEALNHGGHLRKDVIVILNDNEMSISPNVGALSQYLNRILIDSRFRKFKKETRGLIESIPKFGETVAKIADRVEESVKGIFLPGMLFEELGFEYVGPIDGHSMPIVIDTLRKIKKSEKPVLLHLITKKGKGYAFSEEDPSRYHGVGPFDLSTGGSKGGKAGASMTYSDVFGNALADIADKDPRVAAITAAMKEGTGLAGFAERHPKRIFDVGIAEPHAVTFAAGMAACGARPVVAIYSTFLQRSYDEIIHDVCLQNMPVVFAIDRAGIVGEDGPTHQGVFDLSYLRHIPGLTVAAPKDAWELRAMLQWAMASNMPVAIRYPRGKAIDMGEGKPIAIGHAEVMAEGRDVALLAIGNMTEPALAASRLLAERGINASVVNMRFVKPLDKEIIRTMAASHPLIVTLEENALQGGFGSAVGEYLDGAGLNIQIKCIGIPDEFVEQGTQGELRKMLGLDADGIASKVAALISAAAARK